MNKKVFANELSLPGHFCLGIEEAPQTRVMWAEFFNWCQTDPLTLLSMLDRERSKDSGSASMESMTGM